MADMMTFPDTVEEFMEQYKIVDTEQVYTNGTELVPIFRMRQWFEHLKPCEDAVSREAVLDKAYAYGNGLEPEGYCVNVEDIQALPSVTPKEQRWILVSERLPEKPNIYTVTDSKGDVVRFVFYDTESSREYWLRCAKAWMPLPEPYRGEGE